MTIKLTALVVQRDLPRSNTKVFYLLSSSKYVGFMDQINPLRGYWWPSATWRADSSQSEFWLGQTDEKTKLQAKVIIGDDIYDTTGKTRVSDEVVTVKTLLGPLERNDVDILRCVGLNYARHSK